MVRAFLAIDLPLNLKKDIFSLKKEEPPIFGRIKWVELENLHLTLFFFGNLSPKELERVVKVTEKRAKGASPFELKLTGISGFPPRGPYRVVFYGCNDDSGRLSNLVKELSMEFKRLGLEIEDRDFHPHITLFRLKELDNQGAYQSFIMTLSKEGEKLRGKSFLVEELVLFESKLGPHGPKYTPLKTFRLGE